MTRSEEMGIYLQEYRSNRTELKRIKASKEIAFIVSSLKAKVDLLVNEQVMRQEEEQRKIKYLLFCRLLSSGYTQSYELALGLADERLYLDENMSYVYWKPEIIYDEISHEMEEVAKLLRQKYIRIEQYELLYIQRKLFLDDWELLCSFLPEMSCEIAGNLVYSSLLLGNEMEVLCGGYMEEPIPICHIAIEERRENKWEAKKVHST